MIIELSEREADTVRALLLYMSAAFEEVSGVTDVEVIRKATKNYYELAQKFYRSSTNESKV